LQALLFLRQVSTWLQPGLGHDAAGLGTCQLHHQGIDASLTHHAGSCVIQGAHSNIEQPPFASCLLLLLLLL